VTSRAVPVVCSASHWLTGRCLGRPEVPRPLLPVHSFPFPCPVRSCIPRCSALRCRCAAAARTTVAASRASVARRTAGRDAARTMTRPLRRPTRRSRSAGRLATISVAREGAERLLVARALSRDGCIGQHRHLCFCHRPFFFLLTHRRRPCSSTPGTPALTSSEARPGVLLPQSRTKPRSGSISGETLSAAPPAWLPVSVRCRLPRTAAAPVAAPAEGTRGRGCADEARGGRSARRARANVHVHARRSARGPR